MLPSASSSVSRRTFLLAAAATCTVVVTACTGRPPGTGPAKKQKPDPLAAVLTSHAALRDRYAVALTAAPSLDPMLAPLHEESVEHVKALAAALARKPPASPSTGASAAPAPPPDPASVIAELRALETTAQQQTATVATTIAADRAPLLGSIAASHACHLVVLG